MEWGAPTARRGRPRGLTGRNRYARVTRELAAYARDGRLPATFEIVYGHAWKGEPRRTEDGLPIVKLERMRRPSPP
jgi:malonyl-CoA O-methyltransferase